MGHQRPSITLKGAGIRMTQAHSDYEAAASELRCFKRRRRLDYARNNSAYCCSVAFPHPQRRELKDRITEEDRRNYETAAKLLEELEKQDRSFEEDAKLKMHTLRETIEDYFRLATSSLSASQTRRQQARRYVLKKLSRGERAHDDCAIFQSHVTYANMCRNWHRYMKDNLADHPLPFPNFPSAAQADPSNHSPATP